MAWVHHGVISSRETLRLSQAMRSAELLCRLKTQGREVLDEENDGKMMG